MSRSLSVKPLCETKPPWNRMQHQFFEKPILNSPYEYPGRHWELDGTGQPTQQIIETRRRAEFITPIPKAKKQKVGKQDNLLFEDDLSTQKQAYDHTAVINSVRQEVDKWRALKNPADWRVTPETARLLQHWRHHPFSNIRPFFCQVEAAETVTSANRSRSTVIPARPARWVSRHWPAQRQMATRC